MKRRVLALSVATLLTAFSGCGGGASPPVSPTPVTPGQAPAATAYLNELVDVMQANSVNRLKIDWTAFRAQVLAAAPGAQTIADTYPGISVALGLLGDHHSFYLSADGRTIPNPTFPTGCGTQDVSFPPLPADIGYIRALAGNGIVDEQAAQAYAASMQQLVREQDVGNLAGWIVDVRGNTGGTIWATVAGIGPVLGIGTAGYFVDPTLTYPWGYDNRGATIDVRVIVPVTVPYELRRPSPRVAVLTDKSVASAGEAIVVAFRARPNTRSFGVATCGVPSANKGYTLSDGGGLALTTSLEADRAMTIYEGPIVPDELIHNRNDVVPRAIEWLRSGS